MLFGAHVSSSGGIWTAIDRGQEIGCDAIQVFTQSPRMWRPTNHTPEAVAKFRERREEAGIGSVVCHALYLVNLASPDPVIYEKSIAAMRASLEAADAIGAEGVIFHVGSHLGAGFDVGLAQIVPALKGLLELTTDDLWLLMENSAGTGGTIGRSTDELGAIYEALDHHPRLGVCLDSCHWYASGVDVTDKSAARCRCRRPRPSDRARPAALPARQRLEGAARLESRPPRLDGQGTDGQGAAHVPRAPSVPGAAGDPRDARAGRARAGRARAQAFEAAGEGLSSRGWLKPGATARHGARLQPAAGQSFSCAKTRKLGLATGIS